MQYNFQFEVEAQIQEYWDSFHEGVTYFKYKQCKSFPVAINWRSAHIQIFSKATCFLRSAQTFTNHL